MAERFCTHCKLYKGFENFGPFKSGKFGLYPVCNECRSLKAKEDYKKERQTYKLYYRAKRRAFLRDIPFTITEADIIIPDKCPVFNVEMKGKYVASLDRIIPELGYVPGNIQVISNRANMLKNDATVEELEQILKFVTIGVLNDG